jgi:hypothetical protein
MPERKTVARARKARREGTAPSTQGDEPIRKEIHHVREGVHGARSTEQAIDLHAPSVCRARARGRRNPPEEAPVVALAAAPARTPIEGERRCRSRMP